MEVSESALNRVSRAMWTVWGYLTGTVGRYLRREVTNEETNNVRFKQEDNEKEEEKEETEIKTNERKTREDLQYPGVKVRAAALQWEKGNIAHEEKEKSKHACASSEHLDKKSQEKDDEKMLDNKSGSRKTQQFTQQEDSPAYIDAELKNRDATFSALEEADLNIERCETNQEQTKKPEEEEKIMKREFNETEEVLIKSEFIDQGLLAMEADLNVERSEYCHEQRRKSQDEEEFMWRENDETEEEPINSESFDQGLLTNEPELNVERNENSQEQRRKPEEEEEGAEIMKRQKDETGEGPIKRHSVDQGLLTKEVVLNVERIENSQEQRRKEEEEGVEMMKREEKDETGEEPVENTSIEQGLLPKEADLNVERNENNQGQGSKQEEEFVDEIMKKENDEREEEPIQCEFIDLGLLTKEADLNVERSEYSHEQRRKSKDEEECGNEFMRRKNDETEEEPINSESVEQGLLKNEPELNVERIEEEGAEIMKREKDETGEEPLQRYSVDQGLLTKEVKLNVERTENSQEQRRKQEEEEEGAEIMKGETDESGEVVKCTFLKQGLLADEADLNVERDENNQDQGHEEEHVDEIMRRENDDTEEEPIQCEFSEQSLLDKETDLNVEMNENDQEQGRKEEEERVEIMKREEKDETGEEPVENTSIEQGLLPKEADLNVERNENNQGQGSKQEEEFVDEIMKKENDEREEEPIQREFIDQGLLTKEADLNVERSEYSHEQRRKSKDEEECGNEFMRRKNDETEEEPINSESVEQGLLTNEPELNVERIEEEGAEIMKGQKDESGEVVKYTFLKQGLLADEADLNVERNENNQDQGHEEEHVDEIMRRENDETEEEPIQCEFSEQSLLDKETDQNVETNENDQEQGRKPEQEEECVDEISGKEYNETKEEPIKGTFSDQGSDLEEQPSVCNMGDTAVVEVVSVEKIMECVYDQDRNDLNVVEQSIHVMTEPENEASKSQLVEEGLLNQLASTWEGRDTLNDELKLEVEMTENATLLQEKEVIEFDNEETKQETVGKAKDGHHEEFSAWEQFTGTDFVEEQKVCVTEMTETLKQVTDKVIDPAQIEHAEMYKKVSEPSMMFDDDSNLAVTMKLQQFEQSKDQNSTSEVDVGQLEETDQHHNGSLQPTVVTKQDVEGVFTRPETGTGNQIEPAETTSQFRAEVAAVDAKKSAERETSMHDQKIMGQCLLEQKSLLEESSDTTINELSLLKAPLGEIKSVPLKQVDETVVESVDEIPSSSMQELEECSSGAQLQVESKSSSPEQTAEVLETLGDVTGMSEDELKCEQAQPECEVSLVEKTFDESILVETPLEDQINQDECTVQDSAAEASSHRLQIGDSEALHVRESEQETLEIQKDSQKDTEEQERTNEAETGLLTEIKDVTSSLGVVEEISGLTKELEHSEWELRKEMEVSERKEHKRELHSHEETSESNMNVELLNDRWECEKELVAEMTDTESMVVVLAGEEIESVKKMEDPITEEEKEMHQIVFSESSKEISKEHEEKVDHGETVVDSKERGQPGLKRGFEKMAGDNDEDKLSVSADLLLPSQASSLDFTVQKSKIAVKNRLVRPPKDPRMLINMASVEPLTPPHPSQPSFIKKSHIEGPSVPSKGVIGFKLPGLGAGFPALRKTEAGRKLRDGEDSESVTSQKSDSVSQTENGNVKQETSPHKPKWTPPRQPGMGNSLMAELKSKLKKPVKE